MMDWFDLLNMDTTATEQPEWDVVSSNPNYTYADEYDKGFGGAFQTGPDAIAPEGKELFPGWTGTGATGLINALNRAGGAQGLLGKGLDFATSKAGVAGIMALLAALDRQRASGGGTGQGYQGPKQYARSVEQGKYGPIVRYAAEGGLMQAYANGGHVRPFPMQDGGFVMTGRAVEGAGGIDDLQQILPEAQPITGPGTATSDSIPATIRGRNGVTPAKVSNGEAYVPPGYDTEGLYALMRELERKA